MARPASSKSPKKPTPKADDPLLTQENFEKELQALASKAREETWSKWAGEQAWVLVQSGTLLSLAAVYSNISQLTLSPVYGSIPSSIWHSKGVMSACFLGWSSNLFMKRYLPVKKPVQLLPLVAAYIPVLQFFVFKVSGSLGANYGPLITEALTFFPLLMLSVSCTATALDGLELNTTGRMGWFSDAMPGIGSYAFYKSMEFVSNNQIQRMIGQTFLQTRLGLQILLTGLYSLFAPSRILLFAIPAMLHTALFNVHVPYSYTTTALNTTMAKDGWALIDRQESLTGYISVIESGERGFRVMRCDHSLLGGEWLPSKKNQRLAEPIYGVFVMLEAVRLVEVPNPILDKEASALVIGLGIGTTPAALIAHGINTTIVEIDPVVHAFATKYFALPPTHTAVIADAVSYASALAQTDTQYDYIVHDVFTGGAEPVELFTLEFLNDLHSLLKPGGVIAINYAGDLLLPSARIIIHTIRTIFPTCRIFRESARPSAVKLVSEGRDFTNMVIFCTKTPIPSSNPSSSSSSPSSDSESEKGIKFRTPTEKDFLGSGARKMFLLPKHEVEERFVALERGDGGVLRRNETERFRAWQQASAMGHWAVMRTVLPGEVWEGW